MKQLFPFFLLLIFQTSQSLAQECLPPNAVYHKDVHIAEVTIDGTTHANGTNVMHAFKNYTFTQDIFDLDIFQTYTFDVKVKNDHSSNVSVNIGIWLDSNLDNTLVGSSEILYFDINSTFIASGNTVTLSGSFTIPLDNGLAGNSTTLRIVAGQGVSSSDPCFSNPNSKGEVEDYIASFECAYEASEPENDSEYPFPPNDFLPWYTIHNGYICSSGDEDWIFSPVVPPYTNVIATLWDMPEDYDLELYIFPYAAGFPFHVGTSAKSGTATEVINYTNLWWPIADYYVVRVFAKNGSSFNGTDSYKLKFSSTHFADDNEKSDAIASGESGVQGGLSSLLLFPNPAAAEVFVNFTDHDQIPGEIMVTNSLGQIVMRQNFDPQSPKNLTRLDVSTLPNGIYVVTVVNETSRVSEKLLVKN